MEIEQEVEGSKLASIDKDNKVVLAHKHAVELEVEDQSITFDEVNTSLHGNLT